MKQRSRESALEVALRLFQAGKVRESRLALDRRLKLAPRDAQALHLYGVIVLQAGEPSVAVDYLKRAVAEDPGNAPLWTQLGEAWRQLGSHRDAAAAQAKAVALQPTLVEAHLNLGVVQQAMGDLPEAIRSFQRAVGLRPNAFGLQFHLAGALLAAQQFAAATEHFQLALKLDPRAAAAWLALAEALFNLGRFDAAAQAAEQAAQLNPSLAEAFRWAGMAALPLGRYGVAVTHLQRACELAPDNFLAHYYFITAAFMTGSAEASVSAARRALELQPSAEVHSNLVFIEAFQPGASPAQLLQDARDWARAYADPVCQGEPVWANSKEPQRRLRVGYVSPHLSAHVLGLYFTPLFAAHDHEQVEVICYASVEKPDGVTARLRGYVDAWHDVRDLDDAALVARIRNDRIDILVDAAMHMSGGRLAVFAARAAPVQVCWFAYPGTTGLTQIDYRITDPFLDPPHGSSAGETPLLKAPLLEANAAYSETSVILPDTFWCYDPLTRGPAVSELPALSHGTITFGCLNNYAKVNPAVLKLWAKVLLALPGSRMILLVPEGPPREAALEVFAAAGVPAERLELLNWLPRADYLETYRRIDVCLDTFPYNGHTVSLDAFWMGVPVVTLVGNTIVGRAGLCQASNLGFPELVAHTEEQFVEAAVMLTRDLAHLADIRMNLRQRLERSPLMDAPRYARNVEAAYRMIWQRWCESV